MTRALAAVRLLAFALGAPAALYWIFRWLGEHARWSGYSPDEQARMADERRRRALGEPDHFDVLPQDEPWASRISRFAAAGDPRIHWSHQPVPGGPTHLARRGEPCGSCGQEEPT